MTSSVSYLGTNVLSLSPYQHIDTENLDYYNSYSSYGTMGSYGSVWTGYNTNSIQQNEELYIKQMESNLRLQQKQREYNAQANAEERALNAKIGELQAVVIGNNQDQFMTKYNETLAKVKEMNPNMADDEARAYLQECYTNATGSNLTQDVKNNGSSDFMTGLKQGSFFGLGSLFTNKKSADQNVRDLNHVETTTSEKAAKIGGRVLSEAASYAAAGAVVGTIFPGIGTAVGAIVGGICGAIGGLIGGLTNA